MDVFRWTKTKTRNVITLWNCSLESGRSAGGAFGRPGDKYVCWPCPGGRGVALRRTLDACLTVFFTSITHMGIVRLGPFNEIHEAPIKIYDAKASKI